MTWPCHPTTLTWAGVTCSYLRPTLPTAKPLAMQALSYVSRHIGNTEYFLEPARPTRNNNNLWELKRILERYGWLERCGWLECFVWLGCHFMSAALEGLDRKALIQGNIFFSERNYLALVSNDLNLLIINRPGVAGAVLQSRSSFIE